MAHVEKTVFISYRRKDISWALAVYQYLTSQKYDVFFDYTSLSGGDFEQVIVSNIKARAHFVLILTPTALDRCNEPNDWLRREIENAVDEKRNIIPLFFDGFSFDMPSIPAKLTGKLATVNRYNGLDVPAGYFLEAMDRLRTRYLNIPLNAVIHPVPTEVRKKVIEEKVAANKALREQKEDIQEIIKPAQEKIKNRKQNPVKESTEFFSSKWKDFVERISSWFRKINLTSIGAGIGILLVVGMGIFGINSIIQSAAGKDMQTPTLTAQTLQTETITSDQITETKSISTVTTTSEVALMGQPSGISVSNINGGIDWSEVKNAGVDFAFAKATEGDDYSDPTFGDNWFGAKVVGLPRGAYHFFRANVDPEKQAELFIQTVQATGEYGELPPVLDLEAHDGMDSEEIISGAKIWLDLVETAFGVKPIIYSGQYFLQDSFSVAGGDPPSWANDYPLWLAQYPNNYIEGSSTIYLPRGWSNWTFWEYTESGQVNGMNAIDFNLSVFNGNTDDFYAFLISTNQIREILSDFKLDQIYQNDDRWKNEKLGNSTETIGGWGSLLTTFTMLLNGIGYDETPITLNEKMKEAGGYQGAFFIPSTLGIIFPDLGYRDFQPTESTPAPVDQIDAYLEMGRPVILQVDWNSQPGIQTHFVLAYARKGNDYLILDPYRYGGDSPDNEVLLTERYHYNGGTLEQEISAIIWCDLPTLK